MRYFEKVIDKAWRKWYTVWVKTMTKNSGTGTLTESAHLVEARRQYLSCGITSELVRRTRMTVSVPVGLR